MTSGSRAGSTGGLLPLAFGLVFLAELLAWTGWGRLGYGLAPSPVLGWVLGFLAFAVVTGLWALSCAPSARYRSRFTPVIKLFVYAVGFAAFWGFGARWLALALAATVLAGEGVVLAAGPERSAAARASLGAADGRPGGRHGRSGRPQP